MYSSKQFSPGGDMDRADRLLVACALLLTDVRCDVNAKEFFWQEIERVRQESKAQIREQKGPSQLAQLFGPKHIKTTAPTTPTAPTRETRLSKTKAPPVSLNPRSQLDALFISRPAGACDQGQAGRG